jgi:UDP-glucuronate 4-epimerase
MKVLISGVAGFIGYHIARSLLKHGHQIVGVDNFNSLLYNSPIKYDRIKNLGLIDYKSVVTNFYSQHRIFNSNISIYQCDISNKEDLEHIFIENEYSFDLVIHLAALANPRLSDKYYNVFMQTNIAGTYNLLDLVRKYCPTSHIIYTSSSSVCGNNENKPQSLYAVTKRCDEQIAEFYSDKYKMKITCLRPFTVYGPFGRPDMALWKFTNSILDHSTIELYNYGNNYRDFTYIDDFVHCVNLIIQNPQNSLYSCYDIGSENPISIKSFIEYIENCLNMKADIKYVKQNENDVECTCANMKEFESLYSYKPNTNIQYGINEFVSWYKPYHNII